MAHEFHTKYTNNNQQSAMNIVDLRSRTLTAITSD